MLVIRRHPLTREWAKTEYKSGRNPWTGEPVCWPKALLDAPVIDASELSPPIGKEPLPRETFTWPVQTFKFELP